MKTLTSEDEQRLADAGSTLEAEGSRLNRVAERIDTLRTQAALDWLADKARDRAAELERGQPKRRRA